MAETVSHGDLLRSIGRIEGTLEQVLQSRKTRDETVDDRLDRIETDLRAIRELLANAKGGWKTLLIIGGIAGTIGGWIIPTFVKRLIGG